MSKTWPNTGRRRHANVTVNDVARLAGVSPMTVSRVVNGEDNVRPTTRDNVNKAIKQLGYRPNKAARSLASANPITIGLIYTNPNNTFFSAMLRGLLDRSHHADTHIVIVECKEGPDTLKTISKMREEGTDGFLLGPPLCDSESAMEMLSKNRIPAVTVGSQHSVERVSSVCVDDRRAAHAMTKYIVSLGHERVAFIIGNPGQSASWQRLAGYREAMEEAGLELHAELIVQGRFAYRSGTEIAEQLLDLEHPPTAIIASNDDMAAGAIAAAHHRNINVPGELTVCGFDDTMLATTIEPAITTIRQPIPEMAHTAIEMLEKSIRLQRSDFDYRATRDEMDFELILRDSHAPPPKP